MAKPEDFLAAGALLAVKDKLKNEGTADTISARLYRHPALADRPVVRLVADNLAAGDDLTMEFLGFAAPEVAGPIAKRQRQALGFPGWALINDPAHARYALELVKEFKKAARKAKSKPGHGYDEFVEISKRLGKSVAHFLPSFWEQVGREFLAVDNSTYASRAFGKAREAEKVHALKVDESTRQDAFLEFALGGAVSIKALADYGKDLLSTHDPKAAWKFFRELCVRRTLGGMPPWASMFKDLQPLMKSAGLDIEQEIQSILTEIIDSPAISRAAMAFWDGASKSIVTLVKRDNHVAGVLLNMIPQTSNWQQNDMWPWLKHLKTWGILENAWKDNVPEEARPTGGPAAWFVRALRACDRLRQPIYDILTAMSPRLIQDQVPVEMFQKDRWGNQHAADMDLLDMALELNIPLSQPPGEIVLSLGQWSSLSQHDKDAQNRPRDPIYLARERRYSDALRTALQTSAGESHFESVATGKAGLKEPRREWLAAAVRNLTLGALPLVDASLGVLETKTSPAIFQEFPDVLEQFKEVSLLPSIARTLRGGLMDEYGWPALERVFESFTKSGQAPPSVYGQFPNLIVTDGLKAVVLRGEATVHEAELKVPAGQKVKMLMFADGDLIVWSTPDHYAAFFWNSDPQPGERTYMNANEIGGVAIDVPGGGTLIGTKTVHRGDKELGGLYANDDVFTDGTHWWTRVLEVEPPAYHHNYLLYEFDPATGKKGRKSLPSFLEDFVQDGAELETPYSSLLPFGSLFPISPLGSKDGLIGFRSRKNAAELRRIEGVDGRSSEISHAPAASMLLNQAGSNEFLPVEFRDTRYPRQCGIALWDTTGTYEVAIVTGAGSVYGRGQVAGLTANYLHAFQIRDLAASKKLRSVTDAEVQILLDAEQQDYDNFESAKAATPPSVQQSTSAAGEKPKSKLRDESVDYPLLDTAIRQYFGSNIHPRLLMGLRGVLIRGGQKIRQLAKLIQNRIADPKGNSATFSTPADAEIDAYLAPFHYYYRAIPGLTFMQSLTRVARFFSREDSSVRFPDCWFKVLQILSEGTPERLWSAYCSDPANKNWISFAEGWTESPYQQLPGWFRVYIGESSKDDLFATEVAAMKEENKLGDGSQNNSYSLATPYVGKSSRFLINKNYQGYEVLEYSPDGTFETIPDLNLKAESINIIPPSLWTRQAFQDFVGLAKSSPLVMPPSELLQSVADEVKASTAEVALVWFGLPNFSDYSANFMPSHLREGCKLKTRECSAAKDSLKAMPAGTLKTLVRSVIGGDPKELWESPPVKVAERLKVAWGGNQSDRIPLPLEWIDKLSDAVGHGIDKHRLMQALNVPLTHPMFSDQGIWNHKRGNYYMELVCQESQFEFREHILRAAVVSIAMLAYHLPVGDTARGKIGDILQATTKALKNPKLLFAAGMRYEYEPEKRAALAPLVESVVGKLKKEDTFQIADDGIAVVTCTGESIHMAFRPAVLTTSVQHERLSNQLRGLQSPTTDPGAGHAPGLETLVHLRIARSPGLAALVSRLQETPVPHGGYEANPSLSAPDIVKQIVKKYKIGDDAAAYYLQLLALPDPTDKNVAVWNGGTTAKLKTIAAELLDKKLVIEATRTRAGRKYFLPGGWEDLKAPHLPIETWKLPLFQMTRDAYQRATPPLGRILPLEPVHTLFEKAWKRVTSGDLPKYEEVK